MLALSPGLSAQRIISSLFGGTGSWGTLHSRGAENDVGRSGSLSSPLDTGVVERGCGRDGVTVALVGGGSAGSDSTVAMSNTDFRSAVSIDGVSWMSGRIFLASEKFWIATA